MIKTNNKKSLGKFIIAPVALRRLANVIQKNYKTNRNCQIKIYSCPYNTSKTLGFLIEKELK